MDEDSQTSRLINSRFAATIAVILTAYVTYVTIRASFWRSQYHFHWILPLGSFLPAWAVLTANVAIYALFLSACIGSLLTLQSKERILLAGWVPSVLLGPAQGIVSASLAVVIQHVKAASMMVAFAAAVAILLEGPVSRKVPSESTVPD